MDDIPLTFAAYAGSLRKGSYNRMLLNSLVKLAPPNIRINVLDIDRIPLFNMDVERAAPEPVTRLRETIRSADGLIIVSPEHNGTIPAVTKTVIEWASRPPDDSVLDGKPVAIMGATTGGWGTLRAQLALRLVATAEEIFIMIDPQVRVARVHTKFDDKGELIDDELKRELVEFLYAFVDWTIKIKG
jgi:chromate reductase